MEILTRKIAMNKRGKAEYTPCIRRSARILPVLLARIPRWIESDLGSSDVKKIAYHTFIKHGCIVNERKAKLPSVEDWPVTHDASASRGNHATARINFPRNRSRWPAIRVLSARN